MSSKLPKFISPSPFVPFMRRFTDERARDLSETVALYDEVRAAHAKTVWSKEDAVRRVNSFIVEQLAEIVSLPSSVTLAQAFDRCQQAVLALETAIFSSREIDWSTAVLSLKEQVDLRRFLRAQQHFLANEDRVRGALVLAERDGMDRAQVDWTWKNRIVGRPFIEHALLTSDVMVAAERATQFHPEIKLLQVSHILSGAPESTRSAANTLKLKTRTTYDGKILDLSVIPDAVFGLDFTADRKRKYFFLEADRATMPIMRAGLHQTSFRRKLLAYLAGGGKTNTFGAHFGIGNFRVLTVTTSRERTATMIEALKELTRGIGSSQFLFVDRVTFSASADLCSLVWTSGKGEAATLRD